VLAWASHQEVHPRHEVADQGEGEVPSGERGNEHDGRRSQVDPVQCVHLQIKEGKPTARRTRWSLDNLPLHSLYTTRRHNNATTRVPSGRHGGW
jgi:hypothetical protein